MHGFQRTIFVIFLFDVADPVEESLIKLAIILIANLTIPFISNGTMKSSLWIVSQLAVSAASKRNASAPEAATLSTENGDSNPKNTLQQTYQSSLEDKWVRVNMLWKHLISTIDSAREHWQGIQHVDERDRRVYELVDDQGVHRKMFFVCEENIFFPFTNSTTFQHFLSSFCKSIMQLQNTNAK